jgi:lipopolysaccharide assembly outer membrane protein LptD (OstA)
MRKVFLALIVLLALAVSADAQRPNLLPAPIQEVTAKTAVSSNGSITLLKGDVAITIPGAVVYADEATIDAKTNQVELRGNVRMNLTPQAPAAK